MSSAERLLILVQRCCTVAAMIIARAIFNKIRPPRPSPRELQDQLDFTHAAVLTTAYAAERERHMAERSSPNAAGQDIVTPSKSYERIEKEVGALTPLARRRVSQLALNDQTVRYFDLVHAAQTATPPADLHQSTIDDDEYRKSSDSGEGNASRLKRVNDRAVKEAIERKSVEIWRRNLLRKMLRLELGFSTVVKDSTIPGAGLGLFIEGSAPAGAVVAIYPGFVHLPEHLRDGKYAASLLPDEHHFLMGRADGCLVDGRTAGLLPSSPLTFAHAANHPPKGRGANVLQAAYDFPALGERDVGIARGGRFPERLRPLVPNRYHLPPKVLFGGKLDQSAIVETVVLVACKGGLCDEEIFMDYRFNPNMPHPDWYTPVDTKATEKMWASDKRDSTAQSLFDSSWFRRNR